MTANLPPSAARLARCIELAAKATPGPWVFVPDADGRAEVVAGEPREYAGLDGNRYLMYPETICDNTPYYPAAVSTEDQEAIAAAVNFLRDDAPALLAEVALLRSDAERIASCPWRVQKGATALCQPPRNMGEALARAEAAEQVAREATELLRKAWRILDVDAPNDKTTDAITDFLTARAPHTLARHGARTGDGIDPAIAAQAVDIPPELGERIRRLRDGARTGESDEG